MSKRKTANEKERAIERGEKERESQQKRERDINNINTHYLIF